MQETITTTERLREVCAGFATKPYVTIDTEFVRETTFWPDLCVVQVASDEQVALIDPLADGIDLTPLYDLLKNEQVLKVFHAARQDVEIFFHLTGSVPAPLFDTQVAAMVCGYGDSIAYDALAKRIAGVHIDKSSRFTNWKIRPLTDKQLDYAAADVTHLRVIYESLRDALSQSGRDHWLEQEMAVLTSVETYDLKPENAWRRLKLRARRPAEFEITKRLAQWRETQARTNNVPRSRILKDDAIYEIAQQQPDDERALGRLRTIYKGVERSAVGKAALEIVAAVKTMDRESLPKVPRPAPSPEGTGAAVDLLKVLLKLTSEELEVAQKIIANAEQLEQIAIHGENADVDAMKGWRRDVFGNRALELLTGKMAISFQDRKITTFNREQA
ncbi:MAG: ribonuclease D [Pseudomonadota bacterium]